MPVVVKCPACGNEVRWSEASPYRPFCSERCRTIDLGAWASGRYSIPGASADETGGVPEDPTRPGG